MGTRGTGVLAVAVLLAGGVAFAQPSAEDQAKATELVNDGIKLQSKRDFDGAVGKYKAAYCLIPEPALVYNIGTAYQEASRTAEAASFFRLYLDVAPSGDLASDAKTAIKSLKDKSKKLGEIKCEAPKPPPAPVCLDGASPVNGVCPAKTCAPPTVLVNGACITEPGPPPGGTTEGTVSRHRSNKLLYAGFITAGLGVIGLGVGIEFGIKAQNASDALTNHTSGPWTQDLLDKQKEGRDAERNQIIFTTAGGALIAGGAVMIVIGMRKHDTAVESRAQVTPWIDGDTTGFAVSGRY